MSTSGWKRWEPWKAGSKDNYRSSVYSVMLRQHLQSHKERKGVLVCLWFSDKTLTIASFEEEKVWLTGYRLSLREAKAATEAETPRGCYLLTCSLAHIQLPFLRSPSPPAQGWDCLQWAGSSTSLSNQEKKCPTDITVGQSDGGNSLIETSLPRDV